MSKKNKQQTMDDCDTQIVDECNNSMQNSTNLPAKKKKKNTY